MVYFYLIRCLIWYSWSIAIVQFAICVFATKTLVFAPNTKNRSVVSVSRIHSKKSKVVHHPKNHPIFTHKVVAYPKIISKNILKVVTTYQIPNTIQSQICPYHKDTLLSASHKQNNKTVRATRTYNKVINIPKHSKHNTFI